MRHLATVMVIRLSRKLWLMWRNRTNLNAQHRLQESSNDSFRTWKSPTLPPSISTSAILYNLQPSNLNRQRYWRLRSKWWIIVSYTALRIIRWKLTRLIFSRVTMAFRPCSTKIWLHRRCKCYIKSSIALVTLTASSKPPSSSININISTSSSSSFLLMCGRAQRAKVGVIDKRRCTLHSWNLRTKLWLVV